MLFGALINFFVSRIVYRTAKNTNSVAMKSNALHLLTDVYTSLGVALSLLIVHLTGWYILDPIIGILLASYIMMEAFKLMKETFPPLMDARLSMEEEEQIIQIIESFKDEYIEYHDFRTRRSGAEEYIDFHLVVASNESIETVHNLCDRIEEKINTHFHQANILIHLEPENEKVNE